MKYRTKAFELKTKHRYLFFRIDLTKWAVLFRFSRYYHGFIPSKDNNIYKLSFLCFHLTINSYGRLIR